ncbi:MAG: hypothetical protein II418_01135, partial [Firmicutes bacterium]|nr:hypothetical protein [Bacillota bacterium]
MTFVKEKWPFSGHFCVLFFDGFEMTERVTENPVTLPKTARPVNAQTGLQLSQVFQDVRCVGVGLDLRHG